MPEPFTLVPVIIHSGNVGAPPSCDLGTVLYNINTLERVGWGCMEDGVGAWEVGGHGLS